MEAIINWLITVGVPPLLLFPTAYLIYKITQKGHEHPDPVLQITSHFNAEVGRLTHQLDKLNDEQSKIGDDVREIKIHLSYLRGNGK